MTTENTDKSRYKKTICLLEKEEAEKIFPQRANLSEREPAILRFWNDLDLYRKLNSRNTGKKQFVLHDGPPYANGRIHMGTAMNKILKDITLRARNLEDYHVPYIPGWDCHGLPIEHKVMQELREQKAQVGTLELRHRCRDYAVQFIDIMTEDFRRLGCLADWEHPYRTLDPSFEAAELRLFAKLVERGMVYRSLKPVLWCPGYETALAEAEVEYAEKTSPSIYVKFPSIDVHQVLGNNCGDPSKPLSVLIWTTTPWTIPANLAITLHPRFSYVVMETPTNRLLVARELAERVARETGISEYKLHPAPDGEAFENRKCHHPFLDRESILILGEHVTLEAGSGCVHTAPGHGHDDYLVGMKYGLPVYSPVDSRGCFTSEFPQFAGIPVEKANRGIIDLMKEKQVLLWEGTITHSYPHDWRQKKPVIFRATPQWFVSLERGGLRQHLMDAIDQVEWIPRWGKDRISAMLGNRVEWCISRQRSWGVPIPAIHLKDKDEAILDANFIARLADLVEEGEGVDLWFQTMEKVESPATLRLSDLVSETLKEHGLSGEWFLMGDTLDVWFDSGSTHQAVLAGREELSFPADLYLEGSDQHRGWFQSSLITSVAAELGAPYKAVLTHGYIVDEKGEKFSKSKGNYIEARDAVQEMGADVLRLWVSSEDFKEDISVSPGILKQRSEAYRRFRNTFRFLLTSLADFGLEDCLPEEQLSELDRYELHRLYSLLKEIRKAYHQFEFYRVYHLANTYCTVDLSARYLDILKDRLYTWRRDGQARRSAQTVLFQIARNLIQLMSPLLAFTAEEAWQALRRMGLVSEESVALTSWDIHTTGLDEQIDEDLLEKWDHLFDLRDAVNGAIEPLRKEGVIGQSLEAEVTLWITDSQLLEEVKSITGLADGSDPASLFIVSQVHLAEDTAPSAAIIPDKPSGVAIHVKRTEGQKCIRCWRYYDRLGSDPEHPLICDRCLEAVKACQTE